MRRTQPTVEATSRQPTCLTAANTFSVGFGKPDWDAASACSAATRWEPGYAQP
jgi:hypothetical protein